MGTIPVLIAIDAESIYNDRSIDVNDNDPSKPTFLDQQQANTNIVMMTNPKSRGSVNNAELKIKAKTSNTIQWRAGTFSLGSEWHTVLYECVVHSGAHLIRGTDFVVSPFKVPVPNDGQEKHPLEITDEKVHTAYWTTLADEEGLVIYTFKFAIYDRDLNLKGYYSWDPSIEITA
ncbi:AidA/PixA family protein [Moorena producens]|uniref:AidA/PixA family protein n=1 Tax=Moorena producens TaxID=1155739 RepID=UPI003C737231